MQRYGYPDSLRSTDNEIWGRLRRRFLKRVKLLQKHKHTIKSPYRNKACCPACDKVWEVEYQYVNGTFCWTTTFRHSVRVHPDVYVSPLFWMYTLILTKGGLPIGKFERKVLNAYKGSDLEKQANKLVAYYTGDSNQR